MNLGGSERVVMDTLGIDVDASGSDNMKTFKKITVGTKVFTYDEVVVWFQTLSKLSDCRGLAVCAAEYAHKLAVDDYVDDDIDQGRYWLKAVYWDTLDGTTCVHVEEEDREKSRTTRGAECFDDQVGSKSFPFNCEK